MITEVVNETKNIIKDYEEQRQGEIFEFEPRKNDKVIFIMGLNPGGNRRKKYDGILYFKKDEHEEIFDLLVEKSKKENEETKEGYLYPRYYQPFYKLKECIDSEISMFWTYNEKETKNKVKKMIEEKCTNEKRRGELEKTFDDIFEKEKSKKNKYIMFGDLFYYHTNNYKELEKILIEENLETYINKIIEFFVETYHPNLILVNSKVATIKIQKLLYKNYNQEVEDILLLKKDNGKYKLEEYSEEKLKDTIPIIFTSDITQYLDKLSKKRLIRQVKEVWKKVL